jgi:hypothetical protein
VVRPALQPETGRRLQRALRDAEADCALAFAEAVTAQLAHPLRAAAAGVKGDAAAVLARESEVADALVALAGAAPPAGAALARLADAHFLSACFQNLDLLPAHGCAAGDRVALRVADATARLPHEPHPTPARPG